MRQRASSAARGERGDSARDGQRDVRRPFVRYTYRFGDNMADGWEPTHWSSVTTRFGRNLFASW